MYVTDKRPQPPPGWVRLMVSAIVPEGAVYGLVRTVEAYDGDCKVQIRSADPPAPSRERPGPARKAPSPAADETPTAPDAPEEAPTPKPKRGRPPKPPQEAPKEKTRQTTGTPRVCAVVCRDCGQTFQARSPNAKLCPACKDER